MKPAELRAWIRASREAQDLPTRPTPEDISRVVAVVTQSEAPGSSRPGLATSTKELPRDGDYRSHQTRAS
jgi:hypothetical protein